MFLRSIGNTDAFIPTKSPSFKAKEGDVKPTNFPLGVLNTTALLPPQGLSKATTAFSASLPLKKRSVSTL
jgi:hypothetical protein